MIRLRVKEVAKEKGMSQGMVSRNCNINLNTVRAMFRNPDNNITLDTLNRLAHGLGVHPCDLLEYIPD